MQFLVNVLVSAMFSEQITRLSIQAAAKAKFATRKNTSPPKKVSFSVKKAWRGIVKNLDYVLCCVLESYSIRGFMDMAFQII